MYTPNGSDLRFNINKKHKQIFQLCEIVSISLQEKHQRWTETPKEGRELPAGVNVSSTNQMKYSAKPRASQNRGPRNPTNQYNIVLHRLIISKLGWYLQSKCFFFGPITSSVVALHTTLANPWPAMLCFAAVTRSIMLCFDMAANSVCCKSQKLNMWAERPLKWYRNTLRATWKGEDVPNEYQDGGSE